MEEDNITEYVNKSGSDSEEEEDIVKYDENSNKTVARSDSEEEKDNIGCEESIYKTASGSNYEEVENVGCDENLDKTATRSDSEEEENSAWDVNILDTAATVEPFTPVKQKLNCVGSKTTDDSSNIIDNYSKWRNFKYH